ncbi:hypothetical protein EPN15_02970 [Patescibacteria group bacterium]|nr:MAG: hypothetical protein EPN15_02970 [Patescibacteria group bacterium]
MKTKIRFSILAVLAFAVILFVASQSFAGGSNCNDSCSEPFDQVANGFAEASVNKHVDNGTDLIGINGDGYASGSYETKSDSEADGSAEAWSEFSYTLFSNENKADISAKTKSEGAAETSPVNGPSVVGQESYAKQSNGATIVKNDDNGFSAGNMTYAETSGERTEDCGDGISIVGTSEASGYTKGEMTSGDNFRKTTVETGGSSSAIGMNGYVEGDGSYGGNAGIEKSGAQAYGELGGSWKYSGTQSGSGIGTGGVETSITEGENSIKARTHTHSYSSASGN